MNGCEPGWLNPDTLATARAEYDRDVRDFTGKVAAPDEVVEGVRIYKSGGVSETVGGISTPQAAPSAAPSALSRAVARAGAVAAIHGGGFVLGRAAHMDALCQHWRAAFGVDCASLAYPLAPEARAEAQLEACARGLELFLDRRERRGPVVLVGDSAGGGLAAGLALRLGKSRIRAVCLIQPMLDPRTRSAPDGGMSWTASDNRFGWKSRLGPQDYADPEGLSPEVAPALAEDLSEFPACWIGIGTRDLFLRESLELARRIAQSGGDVTLRTYPDAVHAFQRLDAGSGAARRFAQDRDHWIGAQLD